ncbi:MAG: hypothetical protein M5U28_26750 [Sandaracinaceae bacterium]|nr:hypothetical protein [Sandaracinaceae bacterium]
MTRAAALLAALLAALSVALVAQSARADDEETRGPEVGIALDLAASLGLDEQTLALGLGQTASLALLVRPHPYVSLAAGAHAFAFYGDGAIAWFGTRAGLRLHWGEMLSIDPDAWLEVSHVYGLSGSIARHGVDFGIGLAFELFDAVSAGPSVRVQWIEDPDGTPVWILLFGLTVVGWPGRSGGGAPDAWVSRARPPTYVAPRNTADAPRGASRAARGSCPTSSSSACTPWTTTTATRSGSAAARRPRWTSSSCPGSACTPE